MPGSSVTCLGTLSLSLVLHVLDWPETVGPFLESINLLQECLKQHLLAGRNGSQDWDSTGCSLPELAHCITTEYLESAQLRYTLPVFLSETCQTRQSSHVPTTTSVLKQLGISEASSFGRAFTSSAASHLHASGRGASPPTTAALTGPCVI